MFIGIITSILMKIIQTFWAWAKESTEANISIHFLLPLIRVSGVITPLLRGLKGAY